MPCSPEYVSRCPGNSRCVTHIVTGDSFCLESCYLGNGGCPDDQVCYYERVDEECDQLLEPCFKTACTDVPGITLVLKHAHYEMHTLANIKQ